MYLLTGMVLFLLGLVGFISGLYMSMFDMCVILDWELMTVNSSMMVMTLLLDYISLIFMGCVLLISSMVIFYSHSYMMEDANKMRFLYLVIMFVISMLLLILSPNMISILLGWDGLGLVSYGLVIYFQNCKSYNAGMLTILTNRIGDVCILISIAWMLNFGSWHYLLIGYNEVYMYSLIYLVILASFTKSAQIPFSSWLPAAMAAPTPVSALVHSSTLVTAGIYLLIRFSPLFIHMNLIGFLYLSVMTMLMSGVGAMFEYDLKKIIALSTLSQLGLMMSILLMGFPMLAFFHLITHAFFKALLFMCAGLIIHLMGDNQDIRSMGGITYILPYTCSCFFISNISLCGLPFMSGFYSKDMIIEYVSMEGSSSFFYTIFMISVCITSGYSMRLFSFLFMGNNNMSSSFIFQEDKIMIKSMVMLTFMSIMMGTMLGWIMFDSHNLVSLTLNFKMVTTSMVGMGLLIGLNFSYMNCMDFDFYFFLAEYSGSMWFLPDFSVTLVCKNSSVTSDLYLKGLDLGWGENLTMISLSNLQVLSLWLEKIQVNSLKLYLFCYFLLLLIFLI
nr:NADH dehydrogenase subunit 5 [Myrmedobia distinguenda]